MRRVLIIGSDPLLAEDLAQRIGTVNCEVVVATDAQEGVERARAAPCDLVFVGGTGPSADPVEICRRIRQQSPADQTPFILLAPGKRGGGPGDDGAAAMNKRRVTDELAAILQSISGVLESPDPCPSSESCICRQGIEIDRLKFLVQVDGREVKLTPTEFRILWVLLSEPGRVFSRAQLTNACIGENAPVHERTIDVHIKAIRQKLEERGELIETVRGIGYRFHDAGPHRARGRESFSGNRAGGG